MTVAGIGIGGLGGDGRPATSARLYAQNLAIDRAGNLYVTSTLYQRVRKIEAATGIISTVAGSTPFEIIRGLIPNTATGISAGDGGPATQALLLTPQNVAVDAAGNLYISEIFSHRIRKVDANGIITTVVGTGKEGFSGDGGPATQAQLAGPQALVLDAAGNMYLSDARNRRVRKVDAKTGFITTVAGGGTETVRDGVVATSLALVRPRTLALDKNGNLFIGEGGLNRILKMSPAGIVSIVAGTGTAGFSGDGGPATQAQFNAPWPYVALDSAGNVIFSDTNNHRIRKITPDGIISTVAGTGPVFPEVGSYAGDGGSATDARLNFPGSPAIDAAGNVIFTDSANNRVRKVIGVAAPGVFGGQ